MIVLIESHPYLFTDLEGLIDSRYFSPAPGGRVQLNYVGYLSESGQPQSVLILPKVFRDRHGHVFGQFTPEALLIALCQPDSPNAKRLRTEGKTEFLFRFSIWLFRAIRQFRQRQQDSTLPELAGLYDISGAGKVELSELEVILALVRFHRDNANLLTYIKRTNTAQRHTISWNRTVARQQPLLQKGRPIYVKPVIKQKHINYDEELIVLYLSTLVDLQKQYGFRLEINSLYSLLTEREMDRFKARAVHRLKEIRGHYFSDRLLQIWHLMMLYYGRQEQMRTQRNLREVLIVRDFNIVFEDMIDFLLSDPQEQIPHQLKEQRDGKIVDHIYSYNDLIRPNDDQIYHIGDSKYYRAENEIGDISIFKQYTYARNVIQYNIDLLNKSSLPRPLRYRDDLTEGYNPTPNFFISALINESLDFSQANLNHRRSYDQNRHFEGRLFDRDTLILQAYNINFLFVLNVYVAGNEIIRKDFRRNTQQMFRQQLVDYLNEQYTFWQVIPITEDLNTFIKHHFWTLRGKMYRPSSFTNSILIAYPKADPMDLSVIFDASAHIKPYYLS